MVLHQTGFGPFLQSLFPVQAYWVFYKTSWQKIVNTLLESYDDVSLKYPGTEYIYILVESLNSCNIFYFCNQGSLTILVPSGHSYRPWYSVSLVM